MHMLQIECRGTRRDVFTHVKETRSFYRNYLWESASMPCFNGLCYFCFFAHVSFCHEICYMTDGAGCQAGLVGRRDLTLLG